MSKDSALSFVGPIMDAYNAAEKAGASALRYALECGKHLNVAKENVEAAKGKWKKWRERNLPTVSEETERVYRRLAEAAAKKADVFAQCKSIRDAIKHLSGLNENLNPKPEVKRTLRMKESGSTATGLQPPEPETTSGLEAELENAAADEIISNIHDTDKLAELAKASIAKLTPDKVSDALIRAWNADQLRDLIKRVNAYLTTPQDLTIPPSLRRPLTPAQPSQS